MSNKEISETEHKVKSEEVRIPPDDFCFAEGEGYRGIKFLSDDQLNELVGGACFSGFSNGNTIFPDM